MTKDNAKKRYDREFKLGAVKLVVEEGKGIKQVAADLGVSEPSLRQWVKAHQQNRGDSFPGSGRLRAQDEEVRTLREENRILRMERDILKKTIAFFVERPK